MRLDRDEPDAAEVGITPLIDIMFLLLIFFLTVTTFAQEEREMDLNLPEARNASEGGSGHVLIINVAQDGTTTVDGRPVTPEALVQKLKAAAAAKKDQEVLIRGDARTAFGPVARALDACRGAALRNVAFAAIAAEATGK